MDKGASVFDELALSNLSSMGYITLPSVQNKDYQYWASHFDILR